MIMMTSKLTTMSKDIKDYLHLYLGCEVYNPTYPMWRFRLVAISGVEAGKNIRLEVIIDEQEGPYPDTGWCWPERLKLILRPLSDMTEEEAVVLAKIGKISGLDKKEIEGWQVIGYYSQPQMYDPEEMKWLLSKGFDLFNLIPEGLALDKTRL